MRGEHKSGKRGRKDFVSFGERKNAYFLARKRGAVEGRKKKVIRGGGKNIYAYYAGGETGRYSKGKGVLVL